MSVNMKEQEIQDLLIKYSQGKCTEKEIALIEDAYLRENISYISDLTKDDISEDLKQVFLQLPAIKRNNVKLWRKVASVAAITLVFAAGWWLFKAQNSGLDKQQSQSIVNDISPGINKATLVLANGKIIPLSEVKKGIRIDENKLNYSDGTAVVSSGVDLKQLATITTPRGGTYMVVLQDGTKVLLNAASFIKFPTSFAGLKERKIEIDGEAYLEVARDRAHPFVVTSIGQRIEVLGTHFNINCYDDEQSVKTTLVEGSVKVWQMLKNGKNTLNSLNTITLKPGQQSIIESNVISVRDVDVKAALAWKNGEFIFKENDFQQAMRSIARWYNVDVEYDPSAPKDFRLGGFISRSKNLSSVLDLIELTGKVHFKIQGRRVLVTK